VATAEQLKALLKSFADGDDARFLSVAMQVAAQEARQGHSKLAHELRTLIDTVKSRGQLVSRQPSTPTPLVQPKGELSGLLSARYPTTRLGDMVLESKVLHQLERVLREHRQGHKLREHGLQPRHRVLLLGPPGSGKTMTSSALAGEMSLPLFTIQLDGLMTKFMGETASKLRLVFDAMKTTRGVYFFDEFDSIGGQRSSPNDVGEVRRILNSFLQFLEQDTSDSLIVAATNHPQMLDEALFRRFDDVLEYSYPSDELVERTLVARLGTFAPQDLPTGSLATKAKGLSYAEITRACDEALKEAILADRSAVDEEALSRACAERRAARRSK
jgi:SpoVK/Ycf46/Vps4 family AAA+-type ATPase